MGSVVHLLLVFTSRSKLVYIMFEICKDHFAANGKLDNVWLKLAEELMGEQVECKERLLSEFELLIQNCQEIEEISENELVNDKDFLIRYLRGSNWDVNVALKLITSSFTQVKDYFPFMSAGVPSKLDDVWKQNLMAIPEERDEYGRRIFIFRLGQWDPNCTTSQQLFTAAFTLFELIEMEEKTQIAGVTVVADISGFGFKHLKHLGIDELTCLCNFLTGAFPIWIRRIHIVNNPRIFSVFLTLIKPFINERVRDITIMHSYDLESLHKEVPPSLLPKYLEGYQDEQLYKCIKTAKQLDDHFHNNIENARLIYMKNSSE